MLLQMADFILRNRWVVFHCVWMCVCLCVRVCISTHTHTPRILYIYLSVDGYLDCFHILAIVNKAAINFGKVRVSFWIIVFVFFRYMPRVDFLNHVVVIFSFLFFFLGTSLLFSVVAAPTYIPTSPVHEGSSRPGQHSLLLCLRVAILTDVRWHLVVALICTRLVTLSIFPRASSRLRVFFGEMPIWVLSPVFYSGCLFDIELCEYILYILYIRHIICKHLMFSRLQICFDDGFLCFARAFWFDVVPCVYFCFCFPCWEDRQKKTLLKSMWKSAILVFSYI